MICKNCGSEINLNYCSNCGQPAKLKRIDSHYIRHEIEHLLHFEKGILYTVKELLIRPGDNIREFLTENRSRLVKPIIFIIITSLLYSLVNGFFHIEEQYVSFEDREAGTTFAIMEWIQNHYGYANIMMGLFIAFFIKLFFKKSGYNFYEILILLCFIMGIGMLMLALFAIVQGLFHIDLMKIAGVLFLMYTTYAIADLFNRRKNINYLKALAAYILGMISFFTIATIIGNSIDLIVLY